jgi:hypothetical protein
MTNIKKTNFLFLLFTVFTLIFAGCTKIPDCTLKDTTYEKYKLNEETTNCELYKEIEQNKCGNGVIEESNDETFCNCPQDVSKTHPELGCNGEVGDYLEYTCSEDKTCEVLENKKVVSQIKTIEFQEDYLHFKSDITINKPFILNTLSDNKIRFELSLFNKYSNPVINLKDILITELVLVDNEGFNIGKVLYNQPVKEPGQKFQLKEIELSKTTEYLKYTSVNFKLGLSYTEQIISQDDGSIIESNKKIKVIESSLGDWQIINPDFYEETTK